MSAYLAPLDPTFPERIPLHWHYQGRHLSAAVYHCGETSYLLVCINGCEHVFAVQTTPKAEQDLVLVLAKLQRDAK